MPKHLQFEQVSPKRLNSFFALCQHIQQNGMNYCPEIVTHSTTQDKCRFWLTDFFNKATETQRPDFFMLYKNKIAGIIGLAPDSPSPHGAELGFWVAPVFQRKGIAVESIAFMLNYSFKTLHLKNLECFIEAENKPSIDLVQKCGFKAHGKKEDYLLFVKDSAELPLTEPAQVAHPKPLLSD